MMRLSKLSVSILENIRDSETKTQVFGVRVWRYRKKISNKWVFYEKVSSIQTQESFSQTYLSQAARYGLMVLPRSIKIW